MCGRLRAPAQRGPRRLEGFRRLHDNLRWLVLCIVWHWVQRVGADGHLQRRRNVDVHGHLHPGQPKPKSKPGPEPKPKSKPGPEPKPKSKPGPEPKPKSKPGPEPKPKHEPKSR